LPDRVHNALKISLQPLILLLAVATPTVVRAKKKASVQAAKTSSSDIEQVISCYRTCFPNSFSVRLGGSYIRKMFEWYLAADNRYLLHVCEEHNVIGFCGGFLPRYFGDGSTSGMLQFAMREAVIGVLKKPWLLLHPEIVRMYPLLFRNVRRKIIGAGNQTNVKSQESTPPNKQRAGLVVIGVLPEYRGKGIFELLMKKFEEEAVARGAEELDLSVKKDNTRAVKAYQRSGWKILKDDKQNYVMQKLLAG
jgi:GNAT superfamily N-acetyltransferase